MKIIRLKNAFLLTLSICAISTVGFSQSVKDFYIPPLSNYNKASFYMPDRYGGQTDMIELIWYADNGDGTYRITDAHLMGDQPTSIVTRTVIFTTDEVKMTEFVSQSVLKFGAERENYEPPQTILKMPAAGKTITWTTQGNEENTLTKYTSSWTTVSFFGRNRNAIKVVSQQIGWKTKTISYYVEGVGFMKSDYVSKNGTVTPLRVFDELLYEMTEQEKRRREEERRIAEEERKQAEWKAKKQRELEEEQRKQKEMEIRMSKGYHNLEQYAPEKYAQVLREQKEAIRKHFATLYVFPSFEILAFLNKGNQRFTNTYNVHYERNTTTTRKIELVSGTDTYFELFEYVSISLPTLEIDGFDVMVEAILNNVKVDFTRGITEVKVRNGKVKFKKFPPEQDLQQVIVERLSKKRNGKYLVKYEISDIMGEVNVVVKITEKENKKGGEN